MKSNKGVGRQSALLTPEENQAISNAINQFEEDNPRKKKIVLDMDFLVPLVVKLRDLNND
jgi:hypothetical protein